MWRRPLQTLQQKERVVLSSRTKNDLTKKDTAQFKIFQLTLKDTSLSNINFELRLVDAEIEQLAYPNLPKMHLQ